MQDLADLFRADLSDKRDTITLAEELEVARTYQRMEQLRLGPRLQVEWKIDALPANALVPGLMMQPLLENAIYHGIEPRAEGGMVTITGEVSGGLITIVVRNPLDPAPGLREGNRLALANIRERLELMYGERALDEVRTLRRRVHRDAALPAAGEGQPAAGDRGQLSMGEPVKLKVLIVDDEPPARERLRSLLAEIADTQVVGEAATGQRGTQARPTTWPPTWCCSTCACRAWTGSRRRAT